MASVEYFKKLSECDQDELEVIFQKNGQLRYNVYESLQEDITFWIGEYIDSLRPGLVDWSVGFNNYNYLRPKDAGSFIDAFEGMQHDYELLYKREDPEYYERLIEKMRRDIARLYIVKSDKAFDALESRISARTDELVRDIIKSFEAQMNYSESDLFEHFTGSWMDNINVDDDLYINNSYILLQDVAYTKSFADPY